MRQFLLAMTLLSSPAMALTTPTANKVDPHVCDVIYNPDDVVAVSANAGDNIGIRFDASETIVDVSLSDTANTIRALSAGTKNIVYLKSKAANGMPEQPFIIRTSRPDGTPRDYTFQWKAAPLGAAPPNPIMTAAMSQMKTEDLLSPKAQAAECYLIRFNYPSDAKAAQAAAWRARQAKAAADDAEIALHKGEQNKLHNVHYVAQGDASIGPAEIYDDGNTTTLVFPGNTKIPLILTRLPDKLTDAEVSGTTVEQGGIVKIHGTLPFIRLRDGDQKLCIYNRRWTQIGNNPGTGTTSADIQRTVGTRP